MVKSPANVATLAISCNRLNQWFNYYLDTQEAYWIVSSENKPSDKHKASNSHANAST